MAEGDRRDLAAGHLLQERQADRALARPATAALEGGGDLGAPSNP